VRQLVNVTHAYFAAQASDQKQFEEWEAAINADPAETRKPVSRVPTALLDMMAPAGGVKVAHAR
jgi:hypothetical protein